MVNCVNCLQCVPMKSRVDGRRFVACDLKYSKVLDKDTPEYQMLQEKGQQFIENMIEVKPLEDHACSGFEKRTEDQFDIQEEWLSPKLFCFKFGS